MEQPPSLPQSRPEEPKAPAMSLAARLMNVVAAPGEVFDAGKAAMPSTANWLPPGLILILVSWIGGAGGFPQPAIRQKVSEVVDKPVRAAIEKQHRAKEKARPA